MIDRARDIRLVGLDVDGVLTDGGIYLGDGGEYKRFDIQDGFGVLALREAGIKVAIVTGRVSESVRIRAQEMRVDALAQEPQARKLPALLGICDRLGVSLEQTAFVGDDFPDLAIMRVVGLPVAVANAAPEVVAVARVHLTRVGGHGAVREFAELLLKARGEWTAVVEGIVARSAVAESASVAASVGVAP
jgi:3-deoxy-D-manno-octulosonate 8-phosphate phosphatase (KDO 8-P phosphatase)